MQCAEGCGGYRHDGPCDTSMADYENYIEMLGRRAKQTDKEYIGLLGITPDVWTRSAEQQAALDTALTAKLEAAIELNKHMGHWNK